MTVWIKPRNHHLGIKTVPFRISQFLKTFSDVLNINSIVFGPVELTIRWSTNRNCCKDEKSIEMFDHVRTAQKNHCQMSAIFFNTSPIRVTNQLKEKSIGIKKKTNFWFSQEEKILIWLKPIFRDTKPYNHFPNPFRNMKSVFQTLIFHNCSTSSKKAITTITLLFLIIWKSLIKWKCDSREMQNVCEVQI